MSKLASLTHMENLHMLIASNLSLHLKWWASKENGDCAVALSFNDAPTTKVTNQGGNFQHLWQQPLCHNSY